MGVGGGGGIQMEGGRETLCKIYNLQLLQMMNVPV